MRRVGNTGAGLVTDWIILSTGVFLCLYSFNVLRLATRMRRSYVRNLHELLGRAPPLLAAEAAIFIAWSAVFAAGCGLFVWGWVR